MSGKRRRRARRGKARIWRLGPVRELGLVLVLLLVLGVKLAWDALAESSSLELLWFAGEFGYRLAAAEEALGFLLP